MMRTQSLARGSVAGGVGVFTLLLLLVGSAGAQEGGRLRGSATVTQSRDFAQFLVAADLVIEGRLVCADYVTRRPLGGCGIGGLGPYPALDVRIAVDRVRFGTAEDSVLLLTVVGHTKFMPGALVAGAPVIAWADHYCHDGWRLWGGLCIVTASGHILPPIGSEAALRLDGRPTDGLLRYSALDSALTVSLKLDHSTSAFAGAQAIALLQLRQAVPRTDNDGFTFECDSVRWVMGTGGQAPRFIDMPAIPGCYPEIFPGDSLLVPVPPGFVGDRLLLSVCPRSMRVKNQFAAGFGVPLRFLDYALRLDPTGLWIKPYVGRE